MKMRFTLLAAAVALLGVSASAQTYSKLVEPNPGLEGEKDLTSILTPSNTTKRTGITATKMPGIAIVGSEDHKNLLIDNEENALKVWGKYGPDEKTIGVYADGSQSYVRFRYNLGNQARTGTMSRQINAAKKETLENYKIAYVKFMVGPKPADATTDVLTPRLEIETAKGADNNPRYLVFTFAPITLTDETQEFFYETDAVSGEYLDADGTTSLKSAYYDFYLDGVTTGQFVAFEGFGFGNRHYPKVGFETKTYRELGFRGEKYPVLPGTIFIQAEDFDAPKAGEPLNRAEYCVGLDPYTDAYGYTLMPSKASFWSKGDLSNIRIDAAQNKTGYGIFQTFSDGTNGGRDCDEFSSQNSGLGFALIGMSRMNAGSGTQYGGEYLDETSNKISFEQALDGFGSWFEYTFEMEQDGYVDISLAVTSHMAIPYQDVLTGGPTRIEPDKGYVTNYKKDRAEGGYEVEGLDDDYLKLYGFCYTVALDGVEYPTNWESRPIPGRNNGQIELSTWQNPLKWTNNQVDGVNSKYLLAMPTFAAFDGGKQWWPLYRNEQLCELYDMDPNEGTELAGTAPSAFKAGCDALGETYFDDTYRNRPDFADIPCSAGKHTIRVRATGGVTVFDEIRIRAKKEPATSGIQDIASEIEAAEADAPAEYFDFQGRKVVNPATGIYIVKRGSKVTKEVIR